MADMVIVKPCKAGCKHEYQDEKYGKGQRVHTIGQGKATKHHCTVCGNETEGGLPK